MQFTHEVSVTVDVPCDAVWADFRDVRHLPRALSHLRATAAGDEPDLARLVIALDGRHLEFAAQQTQREPDTMCWQSVGDVFLYVLTVRACPADRETTHLTVTVAYDPPGFLPDIAETLGRSQTFRTTLEQDLQRYARDRAGRGTVGVKN